MTQQHEQISALVDGEIKDQSVISNLLEEPPLAAKWQRYHVIRGALRNELPPQIDLDLTDKIIAAIEKEPTVLAPKRSWQQFPLLAQVVPLLKQGGQFAVAASVAAVMIIGVQQYSKPEAEEPFAVAPPFAEIGIQGGLAPVSLQQTLPVNDADIAQQRKKINALLADHRQQVRLKYAQQQSKHADTPVSEQRQDLDKLPQ